MCKPIWFGIIITRKMGIIIIIHLKAIQTIYKYSYNNDRLSAYNGDLGLDDDMYTTTRKSSAIFAIMVIASTAPILRTSTTTAFTSSVLAAKAGLSDHSSKDSDGNSIAIAVQIPIAGPVITYHLQTTEMKT